MYVNNCNFCGRVTRTVALSEHGGTERVQFSIALNRPGREKAHYLKCVAWGERARNIHQIIQPGQEVYVTGELELRHFRDEGDGSDRRDIFLTIKEFSAGIQPRESAPRAAAIRKPFPPIKREDI